MSQNKKKNLQKETITTGEASTSYISLPQEKRFLVLNHFMRLNYNKKVIIYVSSPSFVQFCEEFMQVEGFPVLTIHEKQGKSTRKKTIQQFRESPSNILVCTDKVAKHLKNVNANVIVQYDPPFDIRMTSCESCECILFTIEEEMEFIRYLKSQHVNVELLDVSWTKLGNTQVKLEKYVKEKYAIYLGARQGYAGYLKAYRDHPNKEIFPLSNISVTKVAKSFGFRVAPFVDLNSSPLPVEEENSKKRTRSEDAESKNIKTRTIYKPVKKFKSKR
ncbi:ATP-dependent RNA helicase DDX18 [Armadillidium nasatum]|uniref:ATP-dependent RNA helicase n=1 Tax=Armadillidium nasatum TaxID=96803 RepID=A0A5N5THR1_9CRUS|nr:ATP-dependent RNA helicase DDX18 [Armadillidium nasatum]